MNFLLKKIITVLLLFSVWTPKIWGQQRPNVIYILADDLGYGDLSCYGQNKFKTPNIDKLAQKGMKFTDHYAGNTVCSPSRAVLMTGQHPGHCSITGNSKEEYPIDMDITVLPEIFKNAGYNTGAYGKWGLGFTDEGGARNPLNHGFDEFYGWQTQGTAHTYYPENMVHNGQKVSIEPGAYVHDIIMDKAFNFIEDNAKSKTPFFCYIPTAIPHAAMHAPKDLHDFWRAKLPQFEDKVGTYYADPEPCPDVVNPVAAFPAMVQHLDGQIGNILKILEKYDIDKNTLIIFSSDNGPHGEGGHDYEFWDSNGALKGHKRDVYEGGIRVPMLAYWPSKIKAGSLSNHVSAFWDVMATVSDLLQQPLPEQCDGISFLPTLLSENEKQKQPDYMYWKFTNWNATKYAVRIENYKGVQIFKEKTNEDEASWLPFELYDLSKDIGEQDNIALENLDIVSKMKNIIEFYNQQ